MMRPRRTTGFCVVALPFLCYPVVAAAPTAANARFDEYVRRNEALIAARHASAKAFVAPTCVVAAGGSPCVERVAVVNLPGALLHHWRATEFIPGAKAADLDGLLRDVDRYPAIFTPQVERASAVAEGPDHLQVSMRLRQHHVLTVVLDAAYGVIFGQLDAEHRYSISRSTRVNELDSDGHALPTDREHGFLWRQNTCWSYEERDGGLLVQVESLSLTRAVPYGLGWAVDPYVETIPRDSLEFMLHCVSTALLAGKAHSVHTNLVQGDR